MKGQRRYLFFVLSYGETEFRSVVSSIWGCAVKRECVLMLKPSALKWFSFNTDNNLKHWPYVTTLIKAVADLISCVFPPSNGPKNTIKTVPGFNEHILLYSHLADAFSPSLPPQPISACARAIKKILMRRRNLDDVHLRQVVQLLQALVPSCTFAHCANSFSYSVTKVLITTSRQSWERMATQERRTEMCPWNQHFCFFSLLWSEVKQ